MDDHTKCLEPSGRKMQNQEVGRPRQAGARATTASVLQTVASTRQTGLPLLERAKDDGFTEVTSGGDRKRQVEAHIEIRVDNRSAMDDCLNTAVERIMEVALQRQLYGILVTRLAGGRFRVELNESVPYGYTEQRDERDVSS